MARKHAPFWGTYPVGTKALYSNGSPHWAYDYLCPMNTLVVTGRYIKA